MKKSLWLESEKRPQNKAFLLGLGHPWDFWSSITWYTILLQLCVICVFWFQGVYSGVVSWAVCLPFVDDPTERGFEKILIPTDLLEQIPRSFW